MMYRYKRHLEPWRGRIRSLQCACSGCEPPQSQGSSRDCAAWAEWTSVSAWGAALAALTNSRWIEPSGAAAAPTRGAKRANACSAHMCRCFRGWRAINWQHSLRCRRHSCVCASQLLHVCPQRACTAHPRSVRAHSFSMVPMARRGGWGGEGGGTGPRRGGGDRTSQGQHVAAECRSSVCWECWQRGRGLHAGYHGVSFGGACCRRRGAGAGGS